MREEDLLDAWHDGDEAAGRELLESCSPPLCRFFRAALDESVNPSIQQTVLLARERFERLLESESFRAYLFSIARQELFRILRQHASVRDELDFAVTSVVDVRPPTGPVSARTKETALLVAGLRRLPVDEQIAIELAAWEDFTHPEIAEVLGVHRDTIKRRLQRARTSLREELQALGEGRPVGEAELDRWMRTAASDLCRPA